MLYQTEEYTSTLGKISHLLVTAAFIIGDFSSFVQNKYKKEYSVFFQNT